MTIENILDFQTILPLKNHITIVVTENVASVLKYTCTVILGDQSVTFEKLPSDTPTQEQFFELESILKSMYHAQGITISHNTGVTQTDLVKTATATINSICEDEDDNEEITTEIKILDGGNDIDPLNPDFDFQNIQNLKFLTTEKQKIIYDNCTICVCVFSQQVSSYVRVLGKTNTGTAVELAYLDNPPTNNIYQVFLNWTDIIDVFEYAPETFELQLETEGEGVSDTIQYKYVPYKSALGGIMYLNSKGGWELENYKNSRTIEEEIMRSMANVPVFYNNPTQADTVVFGINQKTFTKITLGLYNSTKMYYLKDILLSRIVADYRDGNLFPITTQNNKIRTYGYPAEVATLELICTYQNIRTRPAVSPLPIMPTHALKFDGVNDYILPSQTYLQNVFQNNLQFNQEFEIEFEFKIDNSFYNGTGLGGFGQGVFLNALSNSAFDTTTRGLSIGSFANGNILILFIRNLKYRYFAFDLNPVTYPIGSVVKITGKFKNGFVIDTYINDVLTTPTVYINNLDSFITFNSPISIANYFNNSAFIGKGVINNITIWSGLTRATKLMDFRPQYPNKINLNSLTFTDSADTNISYEILGKTLPLSLSTDFEEL